MTEPNPDGTVWTPRPPDPEPAPIPALGPYEPAVPQPPSELPPEPEEAT